MSPVRVVRGAICGVVATGPMTAAMILRHRRLPAHERYPLPPREITGAVLEQSGLDVSPAQTSAPTLLAHFAYGGDARGCCGLMPARRILRPASEHPVHGSALMLGAHFIWGVALSALHRLSPAGFPATRPALQRRAIPDADRIGYAATR